MAREEIEAALNAEWPTANDGETSATRGSKKITVGCITIPIPFFPVKICVDLRASW